MIATFVWLLVPARPVLVAVNERELTGQKKLESGVGQTDKGVEPADGRKVMDEPLSIKLRASVLPLTFAVNVPDELAANI